MRHYRQQPESYEVACGVLSHKRRKGHAHELVARAQPDGYTLCWAISQVLVVNPHLYKKLSFDPQKDFVLILLLGSLQYILVEHRSVQANSVRELIALVI